MSKFSLCWQCTKVCIACKKPVDGWNAIFRPVLICNGKNPKYVDSWFVNSCPNFEKVLRGLEKKRVKHSEYIKFVG